MYITTEFIILHLMFNNSYVCLDYIIFQAMSAIASYRIFLNFLEYWQELPLWLVPIFWKNDSCKTPSFCFHPGKQPF